MTQTSAPIFFGLHDDVGYSKFSSSNIQKYAVKSKDDTSYEMY